MRSNCCSQLANSPVWLVMSEWLLSGSTMLSSLWRSVKAGLFFTPIHSIVKKKRPKAGSDIRVAFFQVKTEVKYPFWQCSKGRKTKKKLAWQTVQYSFLFYCLSCYAIAQQPLHKLQTILTLQKNMRLLIKRKNKKSQKRNPKHQTNWNKQERTNLLVNILILTIDSI